MQDFRQWERLFENHVISLKIVDSLKTEAGRAEGYKRTQFMKTYIEQLSFELHC